MTRDERLTACATTTRYRDKSGKLKFKGNRTLKTSQTLAYSTNFVLPFWEP